MSTWADLPESYHFSHYYEPRHEPGRDETREDVIQGLCQLTGDFKECADYRPIGARSYGEAADGYCVELRQGYLDPVRDWRRAAPPYPWEGQAWSWYCGADPNIDRREIAGPLLAARRALREEAARELGIDPDDILLSSTDKMRADWLGVTLGVLGGAATGANIGASTGTGWWGLGIGAGVGGAASGAAAAAKAKAEREKRLRDQLPAKSASAAGFSGWSREKREAGARWIMEQLDRALSMTQEMRNWAWAAIRAALGIS